VGQKNEQETDKQQLAVDENEELIQEEIATDESGLSEENLDENVVEDVEEISENVNNEIPQNTDNLWGDAFEAAQVIEEFKKEKPGIKEKIKSAFSRADNDGHSRKSEERGDSDNKYRDDLEAKDIQLKRLAADFDNFRRRQTQEREDLLKYAGQNLILDILPVLDNFERAMSSSKDAKDIDSVISGIELIQKQLFEAMKKNGVEEIEALDNVFDPNYHEAVQQIVNDEKPDHTVINELQKGYTLNGRVIRPSMVIVSTTSE
jgi:molecular chaperone GrpE